MLSIYQKFQYSEHMFLVVFGNKYSTYFLYKFCYYVHEARGNNELILCPMNDEKIRICCHLSNHNEGFPTCTLDLLEMSLP